MKLTRRRFLTLAALGGAQAIWPPLALAATRKPAPMLDAAGQPKFVNALPNPLDPELRARPLGTGAAPFEIAALPVRQSLGLRDPATGRALSTALWGYAPAGAGPRYPGPTFVARRGSPLEVRWVNGLVGADGGALAPRLPLDPTLHWADPLGPARSAGPGPVPLVTHLHGGVTDSRSDGGPDGWFTPDAGDAPGRTGRLYRRDYRYENEQEAAHLWYHDHALGVTRLNVYAGLAGHYFIRDANEDALVAAGALPVWPYEVPLVIQDRSFDASGELHYPAVAPDLPKAPRPSQLPEFFGEFILVNGMAWPRMEVEPRPYRLRLLNGSDSRFYELRLTPPRGEALPLLQIGTDLGLMDTPAELRTLLLAPGERADVVVDFSDPRLRGATLVLRNDARTPYPKGDEPDAGGPAQVMAFRVSLPLDPAIPPARIAANLRPVHGPLPAHPAPVRTRRLLLFEGSDRYGRLQPLLGIVDPSRPALDGTLAWNDPVTETPRVGDTEVWEFFNATADAHPIHLHLVGFRVVDRQRFAGEAKPKSMAHGTTGGVLGRVRLVGEPRPPAPNEQGMKDTVTAWPGEVTRIVATFPRDGEYVWHCHILSHEDHEMMRPYRVEP